MADDEDYEAGDMDADDYDDNDQMDDIELEQGDEDGERVAFVEVNDNVRLSSHPKVDIDPSGVFKYILIKVSSKDSDSSQLIVRGYARCSYHADIYDEVKAGASCSLKFKCLGGGRINHEPAKKNILVYGYSQGFGRADHQKAVNLLKGQYPDYSISFSNDGGVDEKSPELKKIIDAIFEQLELLLDAKSADVSPCLIVQYHLERAHSSGCRFSKEAPPPASKAAQELTGKAATDLSMGGSWKASNSTASV
uniref:Sex-regulated protein janus-B n=1 Tax=Ditylenchus dipsaci TaxID=166011 RepID=A0A915D904_9BILA